MSIRSHSMMLRLSDEELKQLTEARHAAEQDYVPLATWFRARVWATLFPVARGAKRVRKAKRASK